MQVNPTLLSVLSAAKPKIADYALLPSFQNQESFPIGKENHLAITDIPGIIEKCPPGKRFGIAIYTTHQTRKVLLFMIPWTANKKRIMKFY